MLVGRNAVAQRLAHQDGDLSGLPWVYQSSGCQSARSALVIRRPCRPASARANCTRSWYGIAGTLRRRGRSPSQPRSSRREVMQEARPNNPA